MPEQTAVRIVDAHDHLLPERLLDDLQT